MNETRQLASFANRTNFDDLPHEVVENAKVWILDNFAVGFVGSVQPWSNMVAEMVRETGCTGECTVLGQAWRASPSGAALVNGVMVGGFEAEHAYSVGSHPGGNVFPAAMAVAERDHKSGRALVAAMILGYEVTCRLAEAQTRAAEEERGFHGPALNGVFGAAIAAGKLLNLDEMALLHAMGIAGSHSAGLYEYVWEGAMTKRLHLGRGGQMGLESAILAKKGFTGPSTILEGKFGYLNAFSPSPKVEKLVENLGKVWLVQEMFIKPYACHGSQQGVVQGILAFRSQHRINSTAIRRVVVAGSRSMMHKHDDREPKSIMGAQLSMPFTVAVALIRDITDPYILNEKTLWDEEVRELAKRVETVVDPRFAGPNYPPCGEVTIESGDSRHVINVTGFKGLPPTPFNFDDACRKFRPSAIPILGKERVEGIIDKVRNIERLTDVAQLACLLGK